MKRLRIILLLVFLAPIYIEAQNEGGCKYDFSGSDRSDYEKAIEAYNNKHYSQCLTLMRKISNKHRTAVDPYFYMGVSAVKCGEKTATIRNYFNKLFKYCPDYPNALAYYYMGVVHYTYKQYGDAIVQLNRYFEITNQHPDKSYDAVYEEASSYLYWSEFLSEAQLNQVPFYPSVVGGVSSKSDEYLPYFSLDGKELYFLRQVPLSRQKTFYESQLGEKALRLFVSERKGENYTYGEMLPHPFNHLGEEGSVTMTADNQLLYYSVMQNTNGYENCDIYWCERKNGIWQELHNAGRNINGERTWESQPSITPDGQYLYFASNRAGGYGGTDIWVCRRLPNGDWSRAENLGPAVNTAGNEKCPFIHADGKTLYFASNGWQGFGGYDMYFINITDTYLARPTNMGLPINSPNDDICFGVSTDGKHGYFASRPHPDEDGELPDWGEGVGGTDIYTFELYPLAQPEEMSIVSGQLKTQGGATTKGTITVLRQKTESDRYIVKDENGRFALALSAKENNAVIVNADGCIPLVVCGNAAQVSRNIAAADFLLSPAKLLGRYNLPLSKHAANKSVLPLDGDATTILDAYVDFLLENPKIHIRIESTRIEEAQAICDYFLSRQLRRERFEYKSNSALSNPVLVITEM